MRGRDRRPCVLVAVASRVERLTLLARTFGRSDVRTDTEFSEIELLAQVLLERRIKKRNDAVSDAPTIEEATLWLAESLATANSQQVFGRTAGNDHHLTRHRDAATRSPRSSFLAKDQDENG